MPDRAEKKFLIFQLTRFYTKLFRIRYPQDIEKRSVVNF